MKRLTRNEIQANLRRKLQNLSALSARAQLFGLLGETYDSKRDLYTALGYKKTLVYQDYLNQFFRQDIARAVIERPVKVSWSGPLIVLEAKEGEETGLEKNWVKLEREMKLKSKLVQLDILTGLGRYGVLLLGLDDITKPDDFIKPVDFSKEHKLLYVKSLGEGSAIISTWDENPKSERYGKPITYQLTTSTQESASVTLNVHYSRVIHVVEDGLESDTYGTPRMMPVFNRLQDLEKIVGGSAEMFWRGARPGYQGIVDKDYTFTTAEENELMDKLDDYDHDLRRLFVNEGVELKTLETQVADPKNHVDVQVQMISSETGIPKRILSGSERGELSSSQDAQEWIAYVQNRREEFVEPCILRPFIDKMIALHILPAPKNGEYSIEWADLFSISEMSQVEIGQKRSTALKEYVTMPIAPEVVPPEAFFELFLGLNQSKIDLIKALKKKGESEGLFTAFEETQMAREIEKQKPVEEQTTVRKRKE